MEVTLVTAEHGRQGSRSEQNVQGPLCQLALEGLLESHQGTFRRAPSSRSQLQHHAQHTDDDDDDDDDITSFPATPG